MKIINESIGTLVGWMREGRHFSIAGYSDAEWHCVTGTREGETTGFGQVLSMHYGQRLLDVLLRRRVDLVGQRGKFNIAVPRCLFELPWFSDGQLDWFLGSQGLRLEALERDMLTDDLARAGDLYPFIKQLRSMPVVVIGNEALDGRLPFENHFIGVSSPNLHLEPGGIERAVARAKKWGKPGVYLVSAGLSAAVIIDKLHDEIPDSWFIDCGSIWDTFAGIGGQREWRAELYADPAKLAAWKRDCTQGKGSYDAGVRGYRRTEVAQDRATDLLDTFNRYGQAMFPQQRGIYKHLTEAVTGWDVLDAGCGSGVGTAHMAMSAHYAAGTDKNQRNVDFANQIYPHIAFRRWDFSQPWDGKHTWDDVVCVEAIEHALDPRRCLDNLRGAATRRLWISTPNGEGKPQPPENPCHVAEYTPREMVEMLRGYGPVTVREWKRFEQVGPDTKADPLVYCVELEAKP